MDLIVYLLLYGELVAMALILIIGRKDLTPLALFALVILIFVPQAIMLWNAQTATYEDTLAIPTSGLTLAGLDFAVYWDVFSMEEVTEVEWGILEPGDTGNVTFYIKNTAGMPITCTFNSSDWSPPEAEAFFTLTADFSEAPLPHNNLRRAVLFLEVSPDITGVTEFAFNIVVTASSP